MFNIFFGYLSNSYDSAKVTRGIGVGSLILTNDFTGYISGEVRLAEFAYVNSRIIG